MQKNRPFEAQLTRLALITSVPLLLLLLWVMVYADIAMSLILLAAFVFGIIILYTHFQIKHKAEYQFRSLSNLLDAMSQGEYSLRARSDQNEGALGEVIRSINGLANRLSTQRRESAESQRLLHTVIEHIDVAIVALTDTNEISFYNPAANKLFLLDENSGPNQLTTQLSFLDSFSSGYQQVIELTLGHQQGRFNVHIEEFRDTGKQHKLLFITDVRTLLRSEERKAWKSLVRVISHEINNSLSPIASISQTLKRLVSRDLEGTKHADDLASGLSLIAERTRGLSEFVNSYKQLAKLPEPKTQHVSLLELVTKIKILFSPQVIVIDTETDLYLHIDPVQIEQVLINLCKNAFEAMARNNPSGCIYIYWCVSGGHCHLTLKDQGPGISNPENLFVPFYSTKKQGSGIGLVLCRQIIEGHNGHLSVTNRSDKVGCCATIELPIRVDDSQVR